MTDYDWSGGRNRKRRTRVETTDSGGLSIDTLSKQPGEKRFDEDECELAAIEREAKHRQEIHWIIGVVLVFLVLVALGLWLSYGPHKKLKEQPEPSKNGEFSNSIEREIAAKTIDEEKFSIYSTTTYLSEIYRGMADSPAIKTDGEFIQECQTEYANAVYPSAYWTVDEVIASYTEDPDIWATYYNQWWYENHYICWTSDYQYCFEMDFDGMEDQTTGWLRVNGMRVKMLDEITYDSIEPELMMERYLSGEWGGDSVRSADGGTAVEIGSSGRLLYMAETECYSEEQDSAGLAYTGYADPWWLDEKYDGPEFIQTDDSGDEDGVWIAGYVKLYPDLSGDFDLESIIMSERRKRFGTLVVTKDGAMLFRQGELTCSWVFDRTLPQKVDKRDLTPNTCSMRVPDVDAATEDLAYIYDGERVLALEPDRQVRVVLDEIVTEAGESIAWSEIIGLKGDTLIFCDFGYGETYEVRTLATEVLSTDFVEMRTFEKEDGLYALVRDDNYDLVAVYLGTEPKQYYLDYYELLLDAKRGAFRAK